MAIQVSSTTVIDNSRNLNNIAGADATTVSSLQSAGLGGASTGLGEVGTYAILFRNANFTSGDTIAGSSLTYTGFASASNIGENTLLTAFVNGSGGSPSGTWRFMSRNKYTSSSNYNSGPALAVRIS